MNNPLRPVFIDTSFFKAFLDQKDEFHQSALDAWMIFHKQQTRFVTTNYIIDESLTLIRFRCGLLVAQQLRELLHEYSQYVKTIRVTVEDDAAAWDWFEKDWSKLSFTDCVSFIVMRRLGLTEVASFDTHFSRAGFNIVQA